ncbi:membrane lipoprotein lipid attachment site-containing protein [Psychrobacillus sp. OK028]|uniref:membrane lipoprotein lipid attachment site-containing protein n=1 Tax=Psychrobacillus sp. OK028 TaxID=1884359 RepID=UPI000B877A6A|nr:membrane lipoprotein lipid attachment site-containing protein [Psychrobacillus sp. OK028]
MRKILFLLFTMILLTACSNQETIKATGEGNLWNAHLIYEMTDNHLSDRGGIEYTGDEELLYVTYSVVTDEGGRGGEVEPLEEQTAISFGTSGGNNPPATKEEAIISLNHATVEIKWRTNTGEYEELINFKVN